MEKRLEVHIGFKFSRAELMSEIDVYKQGMYLAYPAESFEKTYKWSNNNASLNSWSDIIYKNLQLPEVNVVVSGHATHPIIPSKFGETISPKIDQSPERPKRVGGDMDLLRHMAPESTIAVIKEDRIHGASQFMNDNGVNSLEIVLHDVKEELARRAVRLARLNEIEQTHANIPAGAMEAWLGAVLHGNDTLGVEIDMYQMAEEYAKQYVATQQECPTLTPDQLKYGTIVSVAGYMSQTHLFKSESKMYYDIMEDGVDALDNANQVARYAQLTPDNILIAVLERLPKEAQEPFKNAYAAMQVEIQEQYPHHSAQWKAVTAAIGALDSIAELIPKETRYQLFLEADRESRFIDSTEGRDTEEITPFD